MNFITRFFYFLALEVVVKSVLLCFVVTFVVYLLLCITPKAEKKEAIRYNETQSKLQSVNTTEDEHKPEEKYTTKDTLQYVDTTRGELEFKKEDKIQDTLQHIDAMENKDKPNEKHKIKNIIQHADTTGSKYESKKFPYFYIEWVKSILKGNPGRIMAGQRVAEDIKVRFLVTFKLSFASLIPALFISLLLGLVNNKRYINLGRNTIYLLASLPAFLLGYLLFGIFGSNFLIAIITLGLSCGIINEMSRVISNAMEVELTKDYIETARAKGLRETSLPFPGTVGFHAFRNALIAIIPRMCLLFTFIISGSMVVEQVFRLPGLSHMLIHGLLDKDMGRILIVVLLAVILVRIVSILANFLYMLLNPRYEQR